MCVGGGGGGGGGCRPCMGEDVHINEGVQHWINAAVDFKGNSTERDGKFHKTHRLQYTKFTKQPP